MFPLVRMRRLRRTASLRKSLQETRLDASQLIAPLFVVEGTNVREPIAALPGIDHVSADNLAKDVGRIRALGISNVLLFGVPADKHPHAKGAVEADSVVARGVAAIKKDHPDVTVMTDVCVCSYTTHGHCGIVHQKTGEVRNDESIDLLARMAERHAEAGADVVAPSAMMDGQVGAIREGLDEAGFGDRLIMSYSAKFASALYGPFREAGDSAPSYGDRKTYQMQPANAREALRESELDEQEGADILMVKPGLWYLDIIQTLKNESTLPVAAYSVSGEYVMTWQMGQTEEERLKLAAESLLCLRRAGADMIITYWYHLWDKLKAYV